MIATCLLKGTKCIRRSPRYAGQCVGNVCLLLSYRKEMKLLRIIISAEGIKLIQGGYIMISYR